MFDYVQKNSYYSDNFQAEVRAVFIEDEKYLMFYIELAKKENSGTVRLKKTIKELHTSYWGSIIVESELCKREGVMFYKGINAEKMGSYARVNEYRYTAPASSCVIF